MISYDFSDNITMRGGYTRYFKFTDKFVEEFLGENSEIS